MNKLFTILFILFVLIGVGVIAFTSEPGKNTVSGNITFSYSVMQSINIHASLAPIADDVIGVSKLDAEYIFAGVEDAKHFRQSFLIVDTQKIIGKEMIRIMLANNSRIIVSVPNESIIAIVWPNEMDVEEVAALFRRNYAQGIALAVSFKSFQERENNVY